MSTNQPSVVVGTAAGGPSRSLLRSVNVSVLREVALLPVLVVLMIVGTVVSPAFFTVSNFAGIGQQSSALGVVVVGESLILLIGGMDLSLEGTYGLAPMVAAWLIVPIAAYGDGTDLNPYLGIVVLVAVGAAVGLVNGLLIVKGRLNGFVVTLGMTIVLAGLQNGIVKAQTLFNLPPAFGWLGSASWGQLPVSLIVAAAIFVVTGLFLRYHRVGRALYAVGGNPAAARAAGIKVDRVKIGVYVAGSVMAAVGGLMEAGRVSAVTGQQGYQEGIIFSVFAAAVIGGVSLRGGRGNMIGAASGVILLGIVQDILDLANVSNYWIEAIDGAVILFALVLARVVGGEAGRGGALMKLLRVGELGQERPAVLDAEGTARDLSGLAADLNPAFFAGGGLAAVAAADPAALAGLPAVAGRIGAPIARPGKVICIGLNYSDHAAETGAAVPERPVVFMKDPSTVVGPYDDVRIPRGSVKTDWEVELGVVIGQRARYLSSPSDALRVVAGYVVSHDVSEREFQLERSPQWDLGKSCETFNPLGPWLVTADEVPDPQSLRLRLSVNGTTRQVGSTGNMIFSVEYLLWYLSQYMVLEPGDLVNTGTPAGVALGLPGHPYLRAGDVVRLGIAGLGRAEQRFVAAP